MKFVTCVSLDFITGLSVAAAYADCPSDERALTAEIDRIMRKYMASVYADGPRFGGSLQIAPRHSIVNARQVLQVRHKPGSTTVPQHKHVLPLLRRAASGISGKSKPVGPIDRLASSKPLVSRP
jgi:hypothetical protein